MKENREMEYEEIMDLEGRSRIGFLGFALLGLIVQVISCLISPFRKLFSHKKSKKEE